ncbi:MAG: hypothetical protein ACXVP2_11890 [Tumebacillaceae bacterium]
MENIGFVVIPLFYLGLAVCVCCGVLGIIYRSLPNLLVSTILGVLAAIVSMWSIGRFVVVLPIVTLVAMVVIWVKKRTQNSGI